MTSANAQESTKSSARGFDRFNLDPSLLRGLKETGFSEPRPIQADTIPACLEGRDIMGLAQTGTGKTAAFALPILQRLIEEPGRGPLVLILAPTRELATQIHDEIGRLARYVDVESLAIFGGTPISQQVRRLSRSPEIIVGCPGRVLDLIRQRKLDVSGVDTLVLDEADHMFDMGFLPDIKKILAALPSDRQNLLFSATMPKTIRSLADKILNDAHVVELAHAAPAGRIEHGLYETPQSRKGALLERVLASEDCKSAIVFTRTKHRAKRMALQLAKRGRNAIALQGNMSQPQRDKAMSGFRAGRYDILVATDIAARGIDVAGVDYVINFDPPSTPETYTHRIGRTGRSEESGKAVTFVTTEDRDWLRQTERMLGSKIPRYAMPLIDAAEIASAKDSEADRRDSQPRGSHGRGGGGGRARPNGGNKSGGRPGAKTASKDDAGRPSGARSRNRRGGSAGSSGGRRPSSRP